MRFDFACPADLRLKRVEITMVKSNQRDGLNPFSPTVIIGPTPALHRRLF